MIRAGAALGTEVGVHVLAFGAYVNYDRHLERGSIVRAILGFEGGLGPRTFGCARASARGCSSIRTGCLGP